MAAVRKVIVTNAAAATEKYGAAGWAKIRRAVSALATADRNRGITTTLFKIDSVADTAKVGAQPVTSASDFQAAKAAVDAIAAKLAPAYVVLLGGDELVPQAQLINPLWTGDAIDDPDRLVPSDLPYACDVPYSTSISAFRGPTRVVGRIPDLAGVADPAALLAQIRALTSAVPAERPADVPVFALSTQTWRTSTRLSLGKLPGVSGAVRTCPADGPDWAASDLVPRIHFVNCHGAEFDPRWYGEATPGQRTLPPAMEAASLPGLVGRGTVVGTECCYGAALWPPAAAGGQAGVALTYLLQGAGGVFGASTTSYGPAASNEYADVLCRLFCDEVLGGASIGRAVLSARQRFVQGQSFLDPTDLKTLAQFVLLGDPSYQPFAAPSPNAITAGVSNRRRMLHAVGRALAGSALACADTPLSQRRFSRAQLREVLGQPVPTGTAIRTFVAEPPATTTAYAPAEPAQAHVAFIGPRRSQPQTLVVVRADVDGSPEVRVVVKR